MDRIRELEDRLWGRHDWTVAAELADLLDRADRLADLVSVAVAHSSPAWADRWLTTPARRTLAVEQLARRASTDWEAAEDLAALLHHWDRIDDLRARAAAGDDYAGRRAADWLVAHERPAEAIDILLAQRDRDASAANEAATLLLAADRYAEAVAVLTTEADAGDWRADERLTDLLAADPDALRTRADAGSHHARMALAAYLAAALPPVATSTSSDGAASAGDALAELRGRADRGDLHAARRLAEYLAAAGRLGELRGRPDRAAAQSLAEALLARGDTAEAVTVLTAAAETGDLAAAERLAEISTPEDH
jgi:hypothetical protein